MNTSRRYNIDWKLHAERGRIMIDEQIELNMAIEAANPKHASLSAFTVKDGLVSYKFRDTLTAEQAVRIVEDVRQVQSALARIHR
jgi:hypothetical protein